MKCLPIILAVACVPNWVRADVTFQAVERETTILVGGFGFTAHSQMEQSTLLGEWSSNLYSEYTDIYHEAGKPSWARATQVSDINSAGYIAAQGQVGGYDGIGVAGQGWALAMRSWRPSSPPTHRKRSSSRGQGSRVGWAVTGA